ncbi:MAG: hypothetical protein CMM28_07700 [Rhodospirillaceae bacterium]|nr:hypothetical protein [Rhodospirillaceae bacterium]
MAMLKRIGIKRIPAVSQGDRYVMGQKMADVCEFVGIELGDVTEFSVDELAAKMDTILGAAQRYTRQMTIDDLDQKLPNRDRTIRQLCFHVHRIVEGFCEVMDGEAEEFHTTIADIAHPDSIMSGEDLAVYGEGVLKRFQAWHAAYGGDGTEPANAYWGDVTLRELLERVTWHPGQHVRQLKMYMEGRGNAPKQPIDDTVFEGLPMPKKVWDDEKMDEDNSIMAAE